VRSAVDRARHEGRRVEAVRHLHAAFGLEPEQLLAARDLALRQHDQPLARGRPAAHPLRPRLAVRPAPRVGRDRLEHQQLGAVQVPDHRNLRRHARRRLVDRRQVVQVQHVCVRRARGLQRPAPGGDLALERLGAELGEDPVLRVRPVLVGRMHRRVGRHRIGRRQRRGHVERAHVEPGVELARVARLTGAGQRAREHGDLPAGAAERAREVARDVRGPAAREEGERHHGSRRL
jgi:hypothetical protein